MTHQQGRWRNILKIQQASTPLLLIPFRSTNRFCRQSLEPIRNPQFRSRYKWLSAQSRKCSVVEMLCRACRRDVPLFVEHCEAVAAEIDIKRRWLGEQGRRGLSFL